MQGRTGGSARVLTIGKKGKVTYGSSSAKKSTQKKASTQNSEPTTSGERESKESDGQAKSSELDQTAVTEETSDDEDGDEEEAARLGLVIDLLDDGVQRRRREALGSKADESTSIVEDSTKGTERPLLDPRLTVDEISGERLAVEKWPLRYIPPEERPAQSEEDFDEEEDRGDQ